MKRETLLRVGIAIVVVAAAGALGYLGWYAFGRAGKLFAEEHCLRNVETLGRAMETYRAEAGGEYPPKLETLLETGHLSPSLAPVLCCPADEHPEIVGTPIGLACASYYYAPPPEASGDCPVIWESLSNHWYGGNVYFKSGRAMWVPRRYYPAMEEADEAVRQVQR